MKRLMLALALLVSCIGSGAAQTAVSLGTYPQFVSILPNGAMNAFGCVKTFNSGTSTPLATFTDNTGNTQNPNPVPLSAGGVANIWFQTGMLYTVVITTTDNNQCKSGGGTTILTVNGVNGSLLNSANVWSASQTFDATTYFPLSDIQLVFGSPSGTQTTLDVVPQSANYILHTPTLTGNDTLLAANSVQTVTNKNLTTGTEVNGCGLTNGPGTYVCIANNSTTASVLNELAILAGAPSTVTVAPAASTSPILGIVTAGAGTTGNATIQQSGVASCVFDGATTAGDSVLLSLTTNGNCHDTGVTATSGSVATVLSTNAGTGTYQVLLNSNNSGGGRVVCADGTSTTVNANTTSQQTIKSCTFLAGLLNSAGKTFRLTFTGIVAPAGTATSTFSFGWGTSSALGTYAQFAAQGSSSSDYTLSAMLLCTVSAAGASAVANCANIPTVTSGTATVSNAPISISFNSTTAFVIGISCTFGSGSSSNSCNSTLETVEQLN